MLLHQEATARDAGDLEDTTLVVTDVRGSLSGGTLASGKLQADEVRANPKLGKVVADPYALSPDRTEEPKLGDERDQTWVKRDDDLRTWTAPFIMAGINTRIVRRSNALTGWEYGRRFRYREVMGFGDGPVAAAKAAGVSTAVGGMWAAMSFRPSRAVLDRALPKPGEGPDEKARRNGRFRIEVHTRTSSGKRLVARVEAQGDPGYAATSVMLGESALCLALDGDRLPGRGGVLTPATAMGPVLVDRLRAAGQTLSVAPIGD
jgi:short subunit dehydrogenase-like uncharacterized protein